MARSSKRWLIATIGFVVLLIIALFSPPPRRSSDSRIGSIVKVASTGKVVMKGERDEQYLVIARVLESHSLAEGTYALLTFSTDDPSVREVVATVEEGDVVTWPHLYPSHASGYVSG